MEIKYQNLRVLGPAILKVKIPDEILNKLNEYIDKIINDDSKLKKLNYGEALVGDVTQEFLLEVEFVKSSGWLEFLGNSCKIYTELNEGKKISKFNLLKTWVVRQFQNEYNPTHWHNGHISGAGFLKLPKSFGDHKQKGKDSDYSGGKLQLIHGSKMFLCDSTLTIKPEVGDFYFFPNYLMHTVYPFKNTNEERRSISFNATIDNNIYDVYGGN